MSEEEYKETLEDKILYIADKLKGRDHISVLNKELKDIEEPEERDIEIAFKAVLEFIEVKRSKKDKRSNNNNEAQATVSPQSSDNPDKMLSRKDAAKRINVSLSTFKRIIIKNDDFKEYSIGRIKRYKASDVDRLFQILIGSSVPAICKERLGYFGSKDYKILVFEKGRIYDIIYQNSNWITIYNSEWVGSLRLSKTQFRKYFSIEGELEYEANKYNL